MADVTLTIQPTPADSTVTLTAEGYTQVNNTITVAEGTEVAYSVSHTNYATTAGSYTVSATTTIAIELSKPTSIDVNVVAENLSELLTNSVNMTAKFYDLFINPVEMDVELQMYNDENELITVTVPNRAKDRKVALTGNNSPEGVVTANIGATYVDVIQRKIYYKTQGTGNTGWTIVLTSAAIPTKVSDLTDDTATYPIDKANTLTGLTATVSELNYCDGVTSSIQSQLNGKQATLVSGTNIKTINSNSLLGSGNIDINVTPDNETISLNSDDELQAIGVIDSRDSSTALKYWTGTSAQYEAITTKDSNTLYSITDDTDVTLTLLQTIYPVGSIYITTNSTCPLASLFGTWTLVGADRVLQGAGTRGTVGTTLEESLPNITGVTRASVSQGGMNWTSSGALYGSQTGTGNAPSNTGSYSLNDTINFDASRSSSTYQNNAPVQQNAYLVNIYRRTA